MERRMTMLPRVQSAHASYNSLEKKVFIVAEGFEKRSVHWIAKKENHTSFEKAIICKYVPSKKSRFAEMFAEVHCSSL